MEHFERASVYADRFIRPSGLVEQAGWRFKRYDISIDSKGVSDDLHSVPWDRLRDRLPSPAATHDRPGAGVIIRHRGVQADYFVACWWDNQNELLQRIQVHQHGTDQWDDAHGRFSVCVWDLQVIWHERNAFIKHVLAAEQPDMQAYLSDIMPAIEPERP